MLLNTRDKLYYQERKDASHAKTLKGDNISLKGLYFIK